MIKNIFYISIIFMLYSCSHHDYVGYVYNLQRKPVKDASVCEQHTIHCVSTDQNGYFKLIRNENSMNDLVVFVNDKPVDTLLTVWTQHGERINYSFLEGKNDTVYIELKK